MKIRLESRDFRRNVETRAKTVQQLLEELKLLPGNFVVSKNGEIVTEREPLKNGDKLKLYPVISGG